MSVIIPESELAQELTPEQAVEAAYAPELAEVASRLQRALPCLIECDKELAPFLQPTDGTKLSATASGRFPTNARNSRAALFWLLSYSLTLLMSAWRCGFWAD